MRVQRVTWAVVLCALVGGEAHAQKRCTKGIPCGGTCISASKTCRVGSPSPSPAPSTRPPSGPARVLEMPDTAGRSAPATSRAGVQIFQPGGIVVMLNVGKAAAMDSVLAAFMAADIAVDNATPAGIVVSVPWTIGDREATFRATVVGTGATTRIHLTGHLLHRKNGTVERVNAGYGGAQDVAWTHLRHIADGLAPPP